MRSEPLPQARAATEKRAQQRQAPSDLGLGEPLKLSKHTSLNTVKHSLLIAATLREG
jgi:hypothetical protein